MSYKNGEEDDESLRSILLQAGIGKWDSSGTNTTLLETRFQKLVIRLLEDMQSPFRNSRDFWQVLDTSARNLGFATATYSVQEDGFWDKYSHTLKPVSITTEYDTVHRIFQSDQGKNHLLAVSSLLRVSVTRAAALTLDAVRLAHSPDDSFKHVPSLLGSMDLIRRVRDFFYSQQVARIRCLTEVLRFEAEESTVHSAELISSCRNMLHTLDDCTHVSLDTTQPEGETWRRGCFQLLLTLACAPFVPLDRTNVDPATQTLHLPSLASYPDVVTELLLAHQRQYDQVIRTEALECLLVLLYEHMHQGVHRCDYLWMLLAFETQSFFIPKPQSHKDVCNNRNASIVSMILAESMCLWRTFPSASEDHRKTFWIDRHPFFAGDHAADIENELNIILKLLLDVFSVSCVQRKNLQSISQANSYGYRLDDAPEAVAILTLGLLLKLAISLTSANMSRDGTIPGQFSFILRWEERAAQCISTANDLCGVFDYLPVIFSDLLLTSSATKTSLRKHGFKLFRTGDDWERYCSLAYQHTDSDSGKSAAIVDTCDYSSPFLETLLESESAEPASNMTYAMVASEIMMATLSAFRTNLMSSNFSTENISLMCRLTSMVYRNNAVLCEKFWSDWTHYMGNPSKEGPDNIDPICSLLDTSYNMATSALVNSLRNGESDVLVLTTANNISHGKDINAYKDKVQALPSLSPFLKLLASLIPPNNTLNMDEIITNFLPDKMIHVCLLGIFALYAPPMSNLSFRHEDMNRREYFDSARDILESLQIFACLATFTEKSQAIRVLRESVHPDARYGVGLLFAIAKRALKNNVADLSEREIVISSCLAIIGELSIFTQLCDCQWIHSVGLCLGEERFGEYLFCGSDIISSRACFVLQRLCASLLPLTFFYEQDEMSFRNYLKTIESLAFSLIDILVLATPRDELQAQAPLSHIRMDLTYSSLVCVYIFVRATGFISAYHYSDEVKRLCIETHRRIFSVMKSSNFFGHCLSYHLMLPRALGIVPTIEEDEAYDRDSTNESHASEEKKISDQPDFVFIPSAHTNHFLSESARPKGSEEFRMDMIDNAYAALYMLSIWADLDHTFSAHDNGVTDAVDATLRYVSLNIDVERSQGTIELFKASAKFLLWYEAESSTPAPSRPLLWGYNAAAFPTSKSLASKPPSRKSFSSIVKSLLDAMNDFNHRFDSDSQARIILMEKVATLSSLFMACLNRNFLLVSVDCEIQSLIFKGFISILDRYRTNLESEKRIVELNTLASYIESDLVSTSMQSLVAIWDARERQMLTYTASESIANDKLLSLCLSLVQYHISSPISENIGPDLKLLRFGLMLMDRLIRRNNDELSMTALLQNFSEKFHAETLLRRLKSTYRQLPDIVRLKASRQYDWVGFFAGIGLQIFADPSVQTIADFYGSLHVTRQFFMLFPALADLLRMYHHKRSHTSTSMQEPRTKKTLLLLNATSSIADPFFDLISTDLNSIDPDSLLLAMNSIRSLTESALTFFAVKDLAHDRRIPVTSTENTDYNELTILISHISLRLSLLSSSAVIFNDLHNKIKLNLLTTALEALMVIEKRKSSAILDVPLTDACVNLVRMASNCVHQNLYHFTVALTAFKSMNHETDSSAISRTRKSQQEESTFFPPHMTSLLRISIALIESVRTILQPNDDDALLSVFIDCNVVDDTINNFVILSDAILPLLNGGHLSSSNSDRFCQDILDALVSLVDFLFSLSESVPHIFIEKRSIANFLKCKFIIWLLHGSNSALIPEIQYIVIGVLRTLSTLLCTSRQRTKERTFPGDRKILDQLAADTVDFLKTFEQAIITRINEAFTIQYDRESESKPKRITMLSNARSTYAPSFTTNKLKETREILTLLNELFHPIYMKFDRDQELHQNLFKSCLNCFKAQSLFLGSISAARELFSLLRIVDNSLKPLSSHTSNHIHDAMIRHPILSDGIPYARSEAISYAHFASSCCVSVSKIENDMRNMIISNQRRKESTEERIDQSYEDGISNQFVSAIEVLSMECTVLVLSIIDKIHSAGSLVSFSQGKAFSPGDVIQPTAIVSYRPMSSNFHSSEEPLDPSYSLMSLGRVTLFNAVRHSVDIRCAKTEMVVSDVSCSRLIYIEDVKKRKNVFHLDPAPRSFSDLTCIASTLLVGNVSIGHLICVLRWCRQNALSDRHSSHSKELISYLAKSSALLLGTEFNLHMDLETCKSIDPSSIREINCQVRDLFHEAESSMVDETQRNALRSLIGDAVWDFTNDAIRHFVKLEKD